MVIVTERACGTYEDVARAALAVRARASPLSLHAGSTMHSATTTGASFTTGRGTVRAGRMGIGYSRDMGDIRAQRIAESRASPHTRPISIGVHWPERAASVTIAGGRNRVIRTST